MNNLTIFDNGLIPVYQTDTGEYVVNGRELWEKLEVKTDFSDWVKRRFNECTAIENEDFEVFLKNGENLKGGRPTIEYIITLDTAKEMAMLERNEIGKEVRKYFITVEKKYKRKRMDSNQFDLQKIEAQKARAEAMLLNAKNRTFKTIMSVVKDKKLSPIAVQVFGLKGMESVFGIEVGNYLPEIEKTYSATEVGRLLGGISSNRIGKIATEHKLKTEVYGVWVMDKSPHSAKEISSFRYNDKGIKKIKEIIKQ